MTKTAVASDDGDRAGLLNQIAELLGRLGDQPETAEERILAELRGLRAGLDELRSRPHACGFWHYTTTWYPIQGAAGYPSTYTIGAGSPYTTTADSTYAAGAGTQVTYYTQ